MVPIPHSPPVYQKYGSCVSFLTHYLMYDNGLMVNCKTISSFSSILPGTTCEDNEDVFAEVK